MLRFDPVVVQSALRDLCERVVVDSQVAPASLLVGSGGHALFLHELHKQQPEQWLEVEFNALLARIQQEAGGQPTALPLSIAYGLTGIAWLFEYLMSAQGDAYDCAFNSNTDVLLKMHIVAEPANLDLEYVRGLSGTAAYAARRLANDQARELYCGIIEVFERTAIRFSPDRCSWSTPHNSVFRQNPDASDVEFNLGLAHGVPAIIAALIPAVHDPEFGMRASRLVLDGCHWLLDQQQDPDRYKSFYAYTCGANRTTRLGWCYGDMGIAHTLARAGRALGNEVFLDAARNIAMHAARRRACDAPSAPDAGLCHGSAGMMLLFMKLHTVLNSPTCIRAAQYWLDHTLGLYQERGLQGLAKNAPPGTGFPGSESALLDGYAGIGLALLAVSGSESGWTDLMLLNDPEVSQGT